jgi:hypothetical protein
MCGVEPHGIAPIYCVLEQPAVGSVQPPAVIHCCLAAYCLLPAVPCSCYL